MEHWSPLNFQSFLLFLILVGLGVPLHHSLVNIVLIVLALVVICMTIGPSQSPVCPRLKRRDCNPLRVKFVPNSRYTDSLPAFTNSQGNLRALIKFNLDSLINLGIHRSLGLGLDQIYLPGMRASPIDIVTN